MMTWVTDAQELRTLEHRRLWSLVEPDLVVAADLHADDYQLVNPHGQTIGKSDYLNGIAAREIRYRTFKPISQIGVRVTSDMAIVRYQALIDIETPVGREQLTCWHTDSYELRDGTWRAVWSQATAIA
jgi:hypothetical protein